MSWSEYSFILKPSSISGIGVFATHDIAQGTWLFRNPHTAKIAQAKDIPSAQLAYCIYVNENEVKCPERFDRMEIGWYINHSEDPNIENRHPIRNIKRANIAQMLNDMRVRSIYTKKDIRAGEETLIDYNNLDEPAHLKEEYYQPCPQKWP